MKTIDIIKYYNSLTPEQQLTAFIQMVIQLEMVESLNFLDKRIYWQTTGENLGEGEDE